MLLSAAVRSRAARGNEVGGGLGTMAIALHTLDVDGAGRSYRLSGSSSAPLVVILHSRFGSAKQAERSYGWTIGRLRGSSSSPYPMAITGLGMPMAEAAAAGPHVKASTTSGFVRAVVADIANNVSIDPGLRHGRSQCHHVLHAGANTSIFAAITASFRARNWAPVGPRPVSVIHIHGTAIRWSATAGPAPGSRASVRCPINAFWREVNRCGALDTRPKVGTHQAGRRHVVLLTVDDAGHPMAVICHQTLWRFFAAHFR